MNHINENINSFISSSYKHYKIMYHITSSTNAASIMKGGFDVTKSRTFAFGKGINLTSNKDHLERYRSNINNTVILCIIRYNKLKYNTSDRSDRDFLKKHGYTKPRLLNVPKGYDGFRNRDIFVMKNKSNVFPICIIDI